jgi:hypothetical protein
MFVSFGEFFRGVPFPVVIPVTVRFHVCSNVDMLHQLINHLVFLLNELFIC